ncbi:MAG: cellulase family glycosylhydrolase [Spirochaetales bacterium]|nr:cellulase family glycosylhydrolase [Spirochaetales bacterium]
MAKYDAINITGVNLGNWLVLEKWMNPTLFDGTTAEDEYWLPRQLPADVYEARIRVHRSEYINERDFAIIKSWGLDSVRIPVPYFIFGDREPFIGCIEELDKAFNWAERYGLKILIDLHTAPGSQNGFDNGGLSGVCTWSQQPEEVDFVLSVLERLAERYGNREGLLGIQPINEPISERMWEMMDIQKRYPPVDEEMAKGSKGNSLEFLREFYTNAYNVIRKHMADDKFVVIHDAFELDAWKDFMQSDEYFNVILDTHQYLMMAEMQGCEQTVEGYRDFVENKWKPMISEMQNYFPVITGEWCLFNSLGCGVDTKGGQSVLNGQMGDGAVNRNDEERREIFRAAADMQLEVWNECGSGQFFWSYKLLTDTVNTPGWLGWDSWDLGRCVAFGWYPTSPVKKLIKNH